MKTIFCYKEILYIFKYIMRGDDAHMCSTPYLKNTKNVSTIYTIFYIRLKLKWFVFILINLIKSKLCRHKYLFTNIGTRFFIKLYLIHKHFT